MEWRWVSPSSSMAKRKEWSPSGTKMVKRPRKERTEYVGGVAEGIITEWHENQQKSKSGNYIAGRAEGIVTEWWMNGQVSKETQYVNRTKEGPYVR